MQRPVRIKPKPYANYKAAEDYRSRIYKRSTARLFFTTSVWPINHGDKMQNTN